MRWMPSIKAEWLIAELSAAKSLVQYITNDRIHQKKNKLHVELFYDDNVKLSYL